MEGGEAGGRAPGGFLLLKYRQTFFSEKKGQTFLFVCLELQQQILRQFFPPTCVVVVQNGGGGGKIKHYFFAAPQLRGGGEGGRLAFRRELSGSLEQIRLLSSFSLFRCRLEAGGRRRGGKRKSLLPAGRSSIITSPREKEKERKSKFLHANSDFP